MSFVSSSTEPTSSTAYIISAKSQRKLVAPMQSRPRRLELDISDDHDYSEAASKSSQQAANSKPSYSKALNCRQHQQHQQHQYASIASSHLSSSYIKSLGLAAKSAAAASASLNKSSSANKLYNNSHQYLPNKMSSPISKPRLLIGNKSHNNNYKFNSNNNNTFASNYNNNNNRNYNNQTNSQSSRKASDFERDMSNLKLRLNSITSSSSSSSSNSNSSFRLEPVERLHNSTSRHARDHINSREDDDEQHPALAPSRRHVAAVKRPSMVALMSMVALGCLCFVVAPPPAQALFQEAATSAAAAGDQSQAAASEKLVGVAASALTPTSGSGDAKADAKASIVASLSSALASAAAATAVAAAQNTLSGGDARSSPAASAASALAGVAASVAAGANGQRPSHGSSRSTQNQHRVASMVAMKLADSIPEVPYNILHNMKKLDHAAPFYNVANKIATPGSRKEATQSILVSALSTAIQLATASDSRVGKLIRSPTWKRIADSYGDFASEFRTLLRRLPASQAGQPAHPMKGSLGAGTALANSRLIRDISVPALLVLLASAMPSEWRPGKTRRKSPAPVAADIASALVNPFEPLMPSASDASHSYAAVPRFHEQVRPQPTFTTTNNNYAHQAQNAQFSAPQPAYVDMPSLNYVDQLMMQPMSQPMASQSMALQPLPQPTAQVANSQPQVAPQQNAQPVEVAPTRRLGGPFELAVGGDLLHHPDQANHAGSITLSQHHSNSEGNKVQPNQQPSRSAIGSSISS